MPKPVPAIPVAIPADLSAYFRCLQARSAKARFAKLGKKERAEVMARVRLGKNRIESVK